MTVIVGIFDNSQDLDQVIVQLAEGGFEDTVYDQSIVAQEKGGGPLAAKDRRVLLEAFKRHLEDYDVPEEVIQGYANTFYHDGKFVIVKSDRKRAPQVEEIMSRCRASRVNRHE